MQVSVLIVDASKLFGVYVFMFQAKIHADAVETIFSRRLALKFRFSKKKPGAYDWPSQLGYASYASEDYTGRCFLFHYLLYVRY